ncbi:hypothetical protein E0H22_18310 [Rhodopseudomonas boonkerdii]|uniref:hypothetical protein n=1 Tax=Rhodopseudomonas boonkerdii TaxID=475937 RepID=UPI001E5F8ECD|nr:hypothetical protein [Rhodopseudomonas boonkerdii]UGV27464.1 hypothetical protein E0H22_18310 [Rhodopseudomonas boonkerdii]
MPIDHRRAYPLAAALVLLSALASPACADRCDDLARQLKSQIDGINIGRTAANVIYLSHPATKQLRLGCTNRSVTNELFAQSSTRKPTPAFTDLVASAGAVVFTIPKQDTLTGATRCLGRMGLFRGNDIKMRFRRLDFRCTRDKSTAAISVSRSRNE